MLYEELKQFLYSFFCEKERDFKWSSSIDNGLTRGFSGRDSRDNRDYDWEAGRTIPGGRYGCAQFVKICGPESLRKSSLG